MVPVGSVLPPGRGTPASGPPAEAALHTRPSSPGPAIDTNRVGDPSPRVLASADRQLGLLETQLTAECSVDHTPRNLIDRLEALIASSLLMSSPLSGQRPIAASRTLSAFTARIARLNRLLADLIREVPFSARRLAPRLLALRSLLKSLLGHRPHHDLARRPVGAADPEPDAAGVSLTSAVPAAAPDQAPGAGARVAARAHRVATRSAPREHARHATVTPAPLAVFTSGSASSTSGAGATGVPGGAAAPVSAPVAVHVMSRLCGLLSARLALSELPWRSTVLDWRLERPG